MNNANSTNATAAATAARRFFRLAETAAKHGGFWGSAGVSFEEALRLLDETGKEWGARAILEDVGPEWADHIRMGWYEALAALASGERFDARTIARAACRR